MQARAGEIDQGCTCFSTVINFFATSVIDRIGFIAIASKPLATNLTALITN